MIINELENRFTPAVEIPSEPLFTAIDNYVCSILKVLKETVDNSEFPIRINKIVYFDNNFFHEEVKESKSYSYYLNKNINILQIPNDILTRLYEAYMHETPCEENQMDKSNDYIISHINKVISYFVDIYQTLEYDHHKFREFYIYYSNLIQHKASHIEYCIPIINFDSEIEITDILPKSIKMTIISPNKKSELWSTTDIYFRVLDIWDFSSSKFGFNFDRLYLYQQKDSKVEIKSYDDGIFNYIYHILTAFRVLKSGCLGINEAFGINKYLYEIEEFNHIFAGKRGKFFGSNFNVPKQGSRWSMYCFKKTDLEEFKRISNILCSNKNVTDNLHIPLKYFNQSYSREIKEDRIIDFAIVLESSILADVNDELKYRLSIRGAHLLDDIQDKKLTADILRMLYDTRSGIVHNGLCLSDEKLKKNICRKFESIDNFIELTEETIRQILKKYIFQIESGMSLSDINNKIDTKILT